MSTMSSLYRKERKIENCELCEKNPSVPCKCIECKLVMCDNCKMKFHVKFPEAGTQKSIKNDEKEMDFSEIICNKHFLYCKSCDSLACSSCVSKTHYEHDLVEIIEGYNIKLELLRKEKEINIEEMSSKIQKLNTLREENECRFKTEEQEIENHGLALKQMIDKHVAKLKAELQESGKSIIKAYDADIKSLGTTQDKIETKCEELEGLISSNEASKFFKQFTKTELHSVQEPSTPSEKLPLARFIPRSLQLDNIGKLIVDKSTSDLQSINLEIKQHFQTNLSTAHVLPFSDDSLLLSCFEDETLQHVKIEGNKLKVLSSISTEVISMTATPDNAILLSINGNCRLQQLNTNTNQMNDTVYDLSPLQPRAIHVNSHGNVFVSANDQKGRIEIIVMDSNGSKQQVYDHFNKYQVFSCLMKVISTNNGNVHVVDISIEDDCGRVVVLGPVGDTRNIYTGHHDVNKDVPFSPTSIVTTPRDNTIVTDVQTNHLHVLNNEGQLLTFYNTREVWIQWPSSLVITQDNSLWIGCVSRSDDESNAPVYHVQLSAC